MSKEFGLGTLYYRSHYLNPIADVEYVNARDGGRTIPLIIYSLVIRGAFIVKRWGKR